jgi:hypothetical protein
MATQWSDYHLEKIIQGETSYYFPGTHAFVVPPGVTSLAMVCVGAGGGAGFHSAYERSSGGGGGALAWVNNISVTPGETLTVGVGNSGKTLLNSEGYSSSSLAGDSSYVRRSAVYLVQAAGGQGGDTNTSGNGGSVLSGSGGNGGNGGFGVDSNDNSSGGGGGAGGYTGNGGAGAGHDGPVPTLSGNNGSGGGGAGGGIQTYRAGDGGGVFLLGEGPSGVGGNYNNLAANGSVPAGTSTSSSYVYYSSGERYITARIGAGGSAALRYSNSVSVSGGGCGAVRILWGANRAFPSTNVGSTT